MSIAGKVLVAEDEPDILTLALSHLRRNGFEASGFTDPTQALEDFKVEPTKYSIVVTDINMPKMNGIELIKAIAKINPATKFIVMTAYDSLENQVSAQIPTITHQDILRKPFSLVALCSRVKSHIRAIT